MTRPTRHRRSPTLLATLVAATAATALSFTLPGCDEANHPNPPTDPALGPPLPADRGLKSVADFASIADKQQRSVAIFQEMGKVLTHPRCVNCHPSGDRPLQGDQGQPHQPLVVRGADGHGAPAMNCDTCHGASNYRNVPGNSQWQLAPAEMAWQGKTLTQICEQLKDKQRNGGKTLDEIAEHMTNDALVGYAWKPPKHLEAPPGNQALFGQLAKAWVGAGAGCPL